MLFVPVNKIYATVRKQFMHQPKGNSFKSERIFGVNPIFDCVFNTCICESVAPHIPELHNCKNIELFSPVSFYPSFKNTMSISFDFMNKPQYHETITAGAL